MLVSFLLSAIFCAVSASAKSAGCGKAVSSNLNSGGIGKSNNVTFTTSSGVKRTFMLHIPTKYDIATATPLIFSFHGRGETGVLQEGKTRLSDEALNPNMFVVYPDGIDHQWQGDPAATGYNDVGFVLELIGSLEDEFCIDSNRIYSSGFSNGAGFSLNQLACDATASTKIAAFMGGSAAAYQGTSDANCNGVTMPITCNPGRKLIPILETHGSADDVIAYNGGPRRSRCLPTQPRFVTSWAVRDGLSATNVTTSLYNGNVKQYQFGTSNDYPGLVTHYWVNGMGHAWPWANQGSYFDATPVVMAFFNKYALGGQDPSSSTSVTACTTSRGHVTSSSVSQTSVVKAATGTTSALSSIATPTCPVANNTVFTDANSVKYSIHCAADSTGKTLQGATYPKNFIKCIEQCDSVTGCLSVAYNGACYLKGDPGKLITKGSIVNRVAIRI